MKKYTVGTGHNELGASATKRNSAHMLPVSDWLSDLPENTQLTDLVEVQFKQTRKGYFHNSKQLALEKGVMVVVESTTGYDVGEVVLTGKLVELQMRKNNIDTSRYEVRSVMRIATEEDLERAKAAHAREQETMIKARQIAKSLGLEMKVGDVEYQGDGTKAIFYYIADGRVDFRQLIKVYAETFRIRVEMKQIGARQEAGRIGGTGPCGRELCCSTWMINFSSVGTGAARLQNISPNPQKLAGMCAKLKCCLNYEVPVYEDAAKLLPSRHANLETLDATWYFFASDPLAGMVTYSSDPHSGANLTTLTAARAHEILAMNRRGEKPASLEGNKAVPAEVGFQHSVGQGELTRFDRKKKRHNGDRRDNRDRRDRRDNRDNRDNRSNRPDKPDKPAKPQ